MTKDRPSTLRNVQIIYVNLIFLFRSFDVEEKKSGLTHISRLILYLRMEGAEYNNYLPARDSISNCGTSTFFASSGKNSVLHLPLVRWRQGLTDRHA